MRLLFAVLLAAGCVEQTPEGPSEDELKAAKEHILKTAPTPRYQVNVLGVALRYRF